MFKMNKSHKTKIYVKRQAITSLIDPSNYISSNFNQKTKISP